MRIIFIGCVKSSAILLKELVNSKADIVAVITKSTSFVNADFEDLSLICEENNIEYKYVNNINDSDSIKFIKDKQPDIIYCFGWSQIIKKEILQIPTKGVVGFHPTKLPHNRGRHPIIWAIALGLEETASTFFMMDEGADTGAIISQEPIKIAYEDDAQNVYDKIE